MISVGRDLSSRGKGDAAEGIGCSRPSMPGRSENIGAAVTVGAVVRYWILLMYVTVFLRRDFSFPRFAVG